MQQTRCCQVSIGEQITFSIVVGVEDGDAVSKEILEGVFTYPPAMQLLLELLQPSWTVLDLGAHVGTFSLAAAAMGCRVLAVEASPYNVGLLEASIQHNGFEGIQVVPAAVSDRQGTLDFIQAGPWGFVANRNFELPVMEVRATTVDHLVAEMGWEHVDLIKMDIEGSEVAAIRGMRRLLGQPDAPLILYESNGHTLGLLGEDPQSLAAAISECGYNSYLVTPGRLIPARSSDLQGECNVDYLATKRPPKTPRGWQVSGPMTHEETISRVVATCRHPHEHHRTYIARALAQADGWILADKEVERALDSLKDDPHPEVRNAAAWWPESEPYVSRVLGRILRPVRARWQSSHRPREGRG